MSDVLWNKTAGLCGRINGMWIDDFENRDGTRSSSLLGFVNSWEASSLTGKDAICVLFFIFCKRLFSFSLIEMACLCPIIPIEQCKSNPNEKHACKWDTAEDQLVSTEATKMCEHLLKDEKFEKCRNVSVELVQFVTTTSR